MRLVTAWFDLEDNEWSGVTSGLIRGLRAIGEFDGILDLTGAGVGVRAARRWLQLTGRLDEGWLLTPELVALNTARSAWRRRRDVGGVSSSVQFGSFYGRPVRGPLATLEDRTMAQPTWGGGTTLSPRKQLRHRRLQQRLYESATVCCVASRWTGRSLVVDFGVPEEKVAVVGYGNNVELDAPSSRDWTTPRLLFVGGDWRRKNGDAVVRAFQALSAEWPDARLDVVGGHPPLDVPNVTGHGRLRFDDAADAAVLRNLYGAATCFVMPSHEEPFGIAYVEAMQAGLPVIATTVGGPPDFVDDSVGALVRPDDDVALHAAVHRLARPAEAARAGAAARERARCYTWPAVARRVVDALEARAPNIGR